MAMSITVSPFQAGLGADISGVDIREPLSAADRDAIRAAWLANLVLRFRGQPMTDAQHMAFTHQFAELEFNPAKLIEKQYGVSTQTDGRNSKIPPEISVISNIIEDGKAIGGLGDGEAFWHTDSSFVDVPPAASLLRSLECPPPSAGGATSFLNCYSAYDTLPDATKQRIDGLTIIHAATHSSGGRAHQGFETVEDVSKVPGARQPMVRTHPETGRKSLFLGRRINAYVIGLPVAESEELLDELWAHMVQDRFTWTQEWRVGDLVWWDNRCAMHRRDAFDPATRRLMHRTQLKGTSRLLKKSLAARFQDGVVAVVEG
jgi:taurine dioxygenase